VTQPLPDWSDLPDNLRLRVQHQTPERQALWAELRVSADSPAEFLDLLRIRLDNDNIVAAVASALGAAFARRWEPPLRGSAPLHRITMSPVQNNQTTSTQDTPSFGQSNNTGEETYAKNIRRSVVGLRRRLLY
jgi:hypothetical protein